MLVTDMGMVRLANELQPSKTLSLISVTESGMVTLANELQPKKAPSLISVSHGNGNGHAGQ